MGHMMGPWPRSFKGPWTWALLTRALFPISPADVASRDLFWLWIITDVTAERWYNGGFFSAGSSDLQQYPF